MRISRLTPSLLAGVGATGLLVALAAPAAAHVTVQPPEAEVGAYAKLTFRVPNESDEAGTVKLSVAFPEDQPFGSARVKPRPGWTAQIDKEELPEPVEVGHGEVTEAVRTITWTATEGTRIGPEEFDEFEVSVGPLPDVDQLAFPTTQTYDDGEEVAWEQVVEPGSDANGAAEPERPAPTLTLVPADTGAGGSEDSAGSAGTVASVSDGSTDAASADASDGTARALGTAGLVVGFLGLVVGGLGVGPARRGRASSS